MKWEGKKEDQEGGGGIKRICCKYCKSGRGGRGLDRKRGERGGIVYLTQVEIEKRLDEDDLIARRQKRLKCEEKRLARADGDGNFGLWVDVALKMHAVSRGERCDQRGVAGCSRVLVGPLRIAASMSAIEP